MFAVFVHQTENLGHGGRVVTLSPPTSEGRGSVPSTASSGKLGVAFHWSAVYSTEPWPTVCTGFTSFPTWGHDGDRTPASEVGGKSVTTLPPWPLSYLTDYCHWSNMRRSHQMSENMSRVSSSCIGNVLITSYIGLMLLVLNRWLCCHIIFFSFKSPTLRSQ